MHFCWLVIYYSFLSETSSLFWLIILDSQCGYSHLNDGTGELWAGQTKLKEELWSALKDPKVSELVENLGDDVPTGSGSISLKNCFLWTEIGFELWMCVWVWESSIFVIHQLMENSFQRFFRKVGNDQTLDIDTQFFMFANPCVLLCKKRFCFLCWDNK